MTYLRLFISFLLCLPLSFALVNFNSLHRLPHNHYLANVYGDNVQEWVKVGQNDIYIVRNNYQVRVECFPFRP
jgi:hypothetical protein